MNIPDLAAVQLIVGREQAQARLGSALVRLLRDEGGLVLVSGEAGIGKTTLATELAGNAARQVVMTLTGYCYDQPTSPPFGPWLEMLESYRPTDGLPGLPDTLRDAEAVRLLGSQEALFLEVRDFIDSISWEIPLLLVLEDLHWSDRASLDLLRFVSRRLETKRVLIIVTYRDDEIAVGHPLYAALPYLIREGRAERIDLHRFDEAAVGELVEARFDLPEGDRKRLVEYLMRRSEGNPFYLNELLRALEADAILHRDGGGWRLGELSQLQVPSLIRQVIDNRLLRLDPESRELLKIAAVLGSDIPLDLWRRLSGRERRDFALLVDDLARAGFVDRRGQGDDMRFSHAIVQETVYDSISLSRRRSIHLDVAELLAERQDARPSLVAGHFERATDRRAIDWLIASAEQADAFFVPQVTIERVTAAMCLADEHRFELPLSALFLRGRAYETVGDFERALADYEQTRDRARGAGALRMVWEVLIQLALLWIHRNNARSGDYCREALELARELDDPAMIARSLNRLGSWQINSEIQHIEQAVSLHEEALEILSDLDDRAGVAATYDHLGMAFAYRGDLVLSREAFQQAAEILRELDDRPGLMGTLATLANMFVGGLTTTSVVAGPPPTGVDHKAVTDGLLAEALGIAQEIGSRVGEAFCLAEIVTVCAPRGEYRWTLQAGLQAQRIAREIDHKEWIAGSLSRLGHLYMDIFAHDEAERCFSESLTVASRTQMTFWAFNVAGVLANLHIARGELGAAEQLLIERQIPAIPPSSLPVRYCWVSAVRLARARREHRKALDMLDELVATDPSGRGRKMPALQRLRGETLIDLGRFDEAETALMTAREVATDLLRLPVVWRIDAALFKLYSALGHQAAAGQARSSALEIIERLASELDDRGLRDNFIERATARLPGARPFTPARLAPENYAGLTNRELEVLRLVSDGLTDAAAAEALYISPRTVSQHLRSVYGKLGVNNRAAASRVAAEQGLLV